MIYAVLAGACYGLYSIFGKNVSNEYDYPVMMFWQFAIATISSIILLVGIDNGKNMTLAILSSVSTKEMLSIAGIGIIGTFCPYFLYSLGIKYGVKPITASSLTLLEPVSATIFAYSFMNEAITSIQIAGMAIVLFFCFMLAREHYEKDKAMINLKSKERDTQWVQPQEETE